MTMMKRTLLLFAVFLLLVFTDATMHNVVKKKDARKLAQSFSGQIPKTGVFGGVKYSEDADVAQADVGMNNNEDEDDENLGYKNYGKGSDTETHRYFSSEKPYRP